MNQNIAGVLSRQARVPSMFSSVVRDKRGRLKHVGQHHPNLRTNAGLDWIAGVLGDFRGDGGTVSAAVTATTLTDSSKSWSTNQWAGHLVVVNDTGNATPRPMYGVIVSNTGTVLTVTGFAVGPSVLASAFSTPTTSTGKYAILPGGLPASVIALTADSTAPAAGDTTLTSELAVNGFTRAIATTYTHTAGVNSYSVAKTFTCSGGTTTINKVAVFNSGGSTTGGLMPFEALEPSPPTLVSGDTLAQTVSVTI